MYTQSDKLREYIESMQEDNPTWTEQQYINMTIIIFKAVLSTPDKRIAMYNYMHSSKMERYGGNWYWLLRRIRNTGQITRLQ